MSVALPPVERFESTSGAKIYRLACEAFPNFIAYAFLVLDAGPPTLIDASSGYGHSNDHLTQGLAEVREKFQVPITFRDISRVIISHGHIDHFGGLPFVLEQTDAAVGIHVLDRRVLTAYEERVIVATKALRVYLQRAGVDPELQLTLMQMYGFSKKHVRSVPVDFEIGEDDPIEGMEFIHTPGHCPGQVCIVLGDVLLCADHILSRTTPHQAPESITAYTGLGHYLESLEKVRRMGGFDLALGGHEDPIHDVYKRIGEIRQSHERKLERVFDIVRQAERPPTISDICHQMYPTVQNFSQLMALEEVGAHVEYLYQHGQLGVSNLDQIEHDDNPALSYEAA
jgi:glyoxylase-like metal-dependent hydrolase (beta-lactamase superfamily II)